MRESPQSDRVGTDDSSRGTVLVVDDEPEHRRMFAEWLSDTYRVKEAVNGAEALDVIDETVDVVLLDRQMPGLSGKETLARFRNDGFGSRVAMLTGTEPGVDILEMEFDAYLVKPVRKNEVREMVDALLVRNTYDRAIKEFLSLIAKYNALAEGVSHENDEVQRARGALCKQIEEAKQSADEALDVLLEVEGFTVVLQDLEQTQYSSA